LMLKMTPLLLRNLLSPRATRPYPRELRPALEGTRGRLFNRIEECIFCNLCALKCPSQCLTVDKQQATWRYDSFVCVFCGICVEACPAHCLYQDPTFPEPAERKEVILLKGTPKKVLPKKDCAFEGL
jgi:ech hydrogenase subunit F